MAEAEKKDIAKLDFNIDLAKTKLDELNAKLEKISEDSESYAKRIGTNISSNIKIDANNMINTGDIEKKLNTVSGYTTQFGKKMKYTLSGKVDFSKMIDVNKFKKDFDNLDSIGKTGAKKIATTIMSEEIKVTANKQKEQQKRMTNEQKALKNSLLAEQKHNYELIEMDKKTSNQKEIAAYKSALKQEEYNNRVAKSTKTMYDKISEYAKTYIIYQGFNELRQTITEVIDEMVEMEYQMVQIDRVLNDSSINIDSYRDKLIQLAYDYGNSFENVADITLRLAQAGFDAQESLMLTEKTLLALNTAELDATQATDDMVAVMAQWGLMTGTASEQAESYGNIIDRINKVADNFPITSQDILEALKKTSSAFNLAGASIDETIAMIVAAETASQRGGKAIGTALSNITQQLKDAGRLTTVESLGIEVYTDATKTEFNSIIDIISQLSEKMQQLKDAGKENSAEMQNLLEVFTVFRRNIGAGLLGEMAGEDSTYAEVLKTSINSVGYSLQENQKHMQTAKAAQAQFNAELLNLKTSVWDGGVEDVFRSILLLGTEGVKKITELTDTFGTLPIAMGTATLAFSLLSKKMKVASLDIEKGTINVKGFIDTITNIKGKLNEINALQNALKGTTTTSNTGFKSMATNVTAYGLKVTAATVKTLALKAATLALNAAVSLAATAGVMVLTTAIQEMINKQTVAIELQKQAIQSTEDEVEKQESKIETLKEMSTTYDELGKKENRTPEEITKLYELQEKIKTILGEQAKSIDLINGKYEEQKKALDEISIKEQEQLVKELKILKEQKENAGVGYTLPSFIAKNFGDKNYENVIMDYGKTGLYKGSLKQTLENSSIEEAIDLFTKWEENLRSVQGQSVELANTYNWVKTMLDELKNSTEATDEATQNYYEALAKLDLMKLIPEDGISSIEDFGRILSDIYKTEFDVDNLAEYRNTLRDLLYSEYPDLLNIQKEITTGNDLFQTTLSNTITSLQNYQSILNLIIEAQKQYNETGNLTTDMLLSIINSGYLEYIDIVNGKMDISKVTALLNADAIKEKAIAELQDQAAQRIQAIIMQDVTEKMKNQKSAANDVVKAQNSSASAVLAATEAYIAGRISLEEYNKVMENSEYQTGNIAGLTQNQLTQIQGVLGQLKTTTDMINSIQLSSASISGSSRGSGGGSSSSSAAYQAERAAEEAAKAEEEAYKARLKQFKDYISEQERLEQRWVSKQKELGLLTNEDYLYITQQRIERYKKYLKEVKNATWMNAEDRLALEKEYSEKIEDLQVDYLGYLQDQLDEQIESLEKANEEKIKLIEEEADARIAALDKVSAATDRAREEEDYQKERQSILDEIAYWEQRTGREAQEALVEAKKKLQELDEEWQEQLEDWSIEDQIKAIEEERDTQIQAIEDSQAAEIESMKAMYDAKVKMYAETGKIIYEQSVIQSQNLYNAYKQNFIDPISSELSKLNESAVTAPSISSAEQEYETYLIKSGDTLSKIARMYGTTVEKIMEANPYITNKNRIYAGKTLQIPKFHEGGIVGGNKEAFALLKPNEVILKPEWAESLNRMMKYFDNLTMNNASSIAGGPTINVDGDLIRIEANIKNQSDINNLERKLQKMLNDKFNIKK